LKQQAPFVLISTCLCLCLIFVISGIALDQTGIESAFEAA
jgi:hypothetical protein